VDVSVSVARAFVAVADGSGVGATTVGVADGGAVGVDVSVAVGPLSAICGDGGRLACLNSALSPKTKANTAATMTANCQMVFNRDLIFRPLCCLVISAWRVCHCGRGAFVGAVRLNSCSCSA
jgi:hypothetical protein